MSEQEITKWLEDVGFLIVGSCVQRERDKQKCLNKNHVSDYWELFDVGTFAVARYLNIHQNENPINTKHLTFQVEKEIQHAVQRSELIHIPPSTRWAKKQRGERLWEPSCNSVSESRPFDVDDGDDPGDRTIEDPTSDTYERCKDWIFDNCHSQTCRDIVRVRVEHFENPCKPSRRKPLSNTATAKLVGVNRKEIPNILAPLEEKAVKKFRRRK